MAKPGSGSCRKSGPGGILRLVPARLALGVIGLYQRTLSPVLPVLLGPACGCRFSPTCSHYAAEAIRTRGLLAGTGLAVRRLLRCTPLSPGGPDPVPAQRTCARTASTGPSPLPVPLSIR